MRITAEQFVALVHTAEAYLAPTWVGPVSDNWKAMEVAITLQEFMIHEGIVVGDTFAPFEYDDAFNNYAPRADSGSVSASGQGYEHEMVTEVDSGFGYRVALTPQASGPQSDYDFLRSSTIGGVAYAISKFGFRRSNEDAMDDARLADLVFTLLTLGLLVNKVIVNRRPWRQESLSSGPRRAFEEFTRPTNRTGTRSFEPSGPNVSRQLPGTSSESGQTTTSSFQMPVARNPIWRHASRTTDVAVRRTLTSQDFLRVRKVNQSRDQRINLRRR